MPRRTSNERLLLLCLCVFHLAGSAPGTVQTLPSPDDYRLASQRLASYARSFSSQEERLPVSSCQRRFYVMDFKEAEKMVPFFSGCYISKYAIALQLGLTADPCSADTIDDADLIYVPGYFALGNTWPKYTPGIYPADTANMFRPGRICDDYESVQALRFLQGNLSSWGKKIIVAQATTTTHEIPASDLFSHPGYVWAKLAASVNHGFRVGIDISLPFAPSLICSGERAMEALTEPSNAKRFFMSFKGKFRANEVRKKVATMHSDGHTSVIIESWDDRWTFDELLFSSLFSLILPGDRDFTARYAESVCSGGVPVLVAYHNSVPPFEDLIPFSSYGVYVPTGQEYGLVQRLRSELPRVDELRRRARKVCELHFQTMQAQVASLAWILSTNGTRAPWADVHLAASGSAFARIGGGTFRYHPRAAERLTGCLRLAYPLSFEEAEHVQPELAGCLISNYALELQEGLSQGRCIASSLAEAQIVIVPGYATLGCDVLPVMIHKVWPRVPAACSGDIARPGRWCAGNGTFTFYQRLQQQRTFRGKRIAVVDTGNLGLTTWKNKRRPFRGMIWLTLGMQSWANRPALDIALPAAPRKTWLPDHTLLSFSLPFNAKPYLATLSGGLDASTELARQLEQAIQGESDIPVKISSSAMVESGGAMAQALHASSRFVLVVSGDEGSLASGITEAVCSGGVPVLLGSTVSSTLMPPFQSCTDFNTYGIRIFNRQLDDLVSILRNFSEERWQRMRIAARSACLRHFQTMESVSLSVVDSLTLPTERCSAASRLGVIVNQSLIGSIKEIAGERFANMDGLLFKGTGNSPLRVVQPKTDVRDIEIYEGKLYLARGDGIIYRCPVQFTSHVEMQPISSAGVEQFQITQGIVLAKLADGKLYRQAFSAMSPTSAWALAGDEL